MSKVRLDLNTLKTERVEDILNRTIAERDILIDMILMDFCHIANAKNVDVSKSYPDMTEMDCWIQTCQNRARELSQLVCREIGHKGERGYTTFCERCGDTLHI